MKNHFINELKLLRRQLCRQGAIVEQTIRRAIQAFQEGDAELARQVMENDNAIDREEVRIEEECLKILALYQPVAGDLRTVVSCIKMNASLERMADFACHMARRAVRLAGMTVFPEQDTLEFTPMEQLVLHMLDDTLQVIDSSDILLAHKVIESDAAVDAMRSERRDRAQAGIMICPSAAEYYVDCMGVACDLERIADLATDICQQIIYLQTGCIVRHS